MSPALDAANAAYISRVPVPSRAGPYEAHRRVYAAIRSRPVYRRMGDVALIVCHEPVDGAETKLYAPKIREGDQFQFVLYADVSRTRFNEGKRGIRYDPVLDSRNADPRRPYSDITREVGGEWLTRQGEKHGFVVQQLHLVDYQPLQFVRPKTRNTVRLPAVDFQGYLSATESDSFTRMLVKGIGRGKAFGLGLMLVRRA